MASVVQDFVLELGLMDLFSSMCKDMPVDTMATEEILPTEQLWSTEDSDEDDMAAVEDLIQIAPMELSEAPVDISVPESGPVISTEELESDEEDMAAVEGLVQLMLDEPESAEESTSSEESDSDDEMAAVEDMVQVELEEESLLAEETVSTKIFASAGTFIDIYSLRTLSSLSRLPLSRNLKNLRSRKPHSPGRRSIKTRPPLFHGSSILRPPSDRQWTK